MNALNTQCRLAARPVELPKASDWTIVEEPKPVAAKGEFVVKVDYLSIRCRSARSCERLASDTSSNHTTPDSR